MLICHLHSSGAAYSQPSSPGAHTPFEAACWMQDWPRRVGQSCGSAGVWDAGVRTFCAGCRESSSACTCWLWLPEIVRQNESELEAALFAQTAGDRA